MVTYTLHSLLQFPFPQYPPNFLPPFYNPITSISAAHLCMGVGSSTVVWGSYGNHILKAINCQQLLSKGLGLEGTSPFCIGIFSGFILSF